MHRKLAIMALALTSLAGCAQVGSKLTVPPDAQLLAYSYTPQPAPMKESGTYYFYDEEADKVVGAFYTPDGARPAVNLRSDHRYRVYFLSGPATRPVLKPAY